MYIYHIIWNYHLVYFLSRTFVQNPCFQDNTWTFFCDARCKKVLFNTYTSLKDTKNISQFDDNEENIQQPTENILVDEVQEEETVPFLDHCRKILKRVVKGAKKGQEVFHFDCNYCSKNQGPSNSTFLNN